MTDGATAVAGRANAARRLVTALAVAAAVVAADQLTKWWALRRLSVSPIHVIGTLDLELARNTGSAFSLFQGDGLALVAVVVVIVAVLLVAVWRSPTAGRAAVLGLILGGALGNLSDRLFRGDHGAVVDFIDLHFWPTFNVADASIVVGCGLLLVSLFRGAEALVSVLSVVVPASLDGVRVDKAVALVADLSRSSVNVLVDAGRVQVDGITVTSRRSLLRQGQSLRVDGAEEPHPARPGADPEVEFAVVHADAEVIVVDKPAGLVVHPGAGHRTGTLVHGLLARYPELHSVAEAVGSDPDRPGIVHRLDRGTSGLMVVARTPDAYRSLVAQLGQRQVTRRYRTLVLGAVDEESGMVDAPVGRSVSSPTRMAVSRKGKEARTRYRVEQRFELPVPTTLLTATLETGRTHQIRVHLSAIGHPVAGDEVYSRGRSLPGGLLSRPFLHAYALAFDHPGTGERVSFEAGLAEDLRRQLEALTP